MTYRKMLLGLAGAALIASPALAESTNTFDFVNQPLGGDWDGSISQTMNGFTLNGNSAVHGLTRAATDGDAWRGGFAFLFGSANASGTLTLYDETLLEDRWFVVHSLDLETIAGGNAILNGMLEGEVQWTLLPDGVGDSTNGFPTYTSATTGDMSSPVDSLAWSNPAGTWDERIDNLTVEAVPAIKTLLKVYDWGLGNWWTPHSYGGWNGSDLLRLNSFGYWWSGYQSTNDATVIQHRPGLPDLPAEGGFDGVTDDTTVGGLPWRGYWVAEPVPVASTNETLVVEFETKLFVSGDEDHRIMDVFFSENAGVDFANYFGSDFDAWEDELGFALNQSAASNAIMVTFDPTDAYIGVTPPVLSIPLADLGITSPTNGAGGDYLTVKYTAKKTSSPDTWLCNLTISNTASGVSFSSGDQGVVNATAYTSTQYLCIATADDLSNEDAVSGNGGLGGYEIDQLFVSVLLNPPPGPVGYQAFVAAHDLIYGDPNTGEYEDYDADAVLNVYEYGYGGDMTNAAVQGMLPVLVINGAVAEYSHVELKDSESGITYTAETTADLVNNPFADVWDASSETTVDAFFNKVTKEIAATDAQFFQTVITTNAP